MQKKNKHAEQLFFFFFFFFKNHTIPLFFFEAQFQGSINLVFFCDLGRTWSDTEKMEFLVTGLKL